MKPYWIAFAALALGIAVAGCEAKVDVDDDAAAPTTTEVADADEKMPVDAPEDGGMEPVASSGEPYMFMNDYASAEAMAKEEGKPLLIKYTAEWCSPCKNMTKEVFADDGVRAQIEQEVVTLEIDIENGTNSDAMAQWGITEQQAIPYIQVIDLDKGEVVADKMGYEPNSQDQFVAWLSEQSA